MPPVSAKAAHGRIGFWGRVKDEFALGPLTSEYTIPEETNGFWYSLGGVLAVMLGLEVITGLLLAYKYIPDASQAYAITQALLADPAWGLVLRFHFWNSWLIFFLVLAHMFRVLVTGGYLAGKKGLWLTGVALAGFAFLAALTGEGLHWDEVGYGVPWNIHEVLAAFGLDGRFGYTTDDLLNVGTASAKLVQIYAVHIALVPLILGALVAGHFYLVREKGISLPFWRKPTGKRVAFTTHIRKWGAYSAVAIVLVGVAAYAIPHDAGIAPQLIPSSPLYGQDTEPGANVKPTFPISWTAGMNTFVGNLGVDPDIWGTLLGMAALLVALVLVPWVDRSREPPRSAGEAFDLRRRGFAFLMAVLAIGILLLGIVESAITAPG